MGYHIVTVILRDGRRYPRTVVTGGSIGSIAGEAGIPFAEDEIAEFVVTHDKTGLHQVPRNEVLVVLDPDFGDRLRSAWRGQPIWITMSPANAPVVRALWASVPKPTGITGFKHQADVPAEDRLIAELSTIDLHHGPYSSETPYTVLRVVGVCLSDRVRIALSEFGFSRFQERSDGFVANRSDEEARRIRC